MNNDAIQAMKDQMTKIQNLLETAKTLNPGNGDAEGVLEHLVKMQSHLNKFNTMAVDLIPLVVQNK